MIVLLIYDVLDGVVYKGKTLRRIRSKYCFVVFSSMSSCERQDFKENKDTLVCLFLVCFDPAYVRQDFKENKVLSVVMDYSYCYKVVKVGL